MWRTCRGIDELTDVDYEDDLKPLLTQKGPEDKLDDESKEPDPPAMTLTTTTAAACFTQVKMYLSKCRGRLGIPLDYVVRAQLKGPYDVSDDAPEDPPAFGKPDSPYVTIDSEMTARAAILCIDLTQAQLSRAQDVLEEPWLVMSATCRRHVGDMAKCRQILPRQANFGDMVFRVSAHFCVAIFRH
jgi:hypothetical protein